jgi:hypothetical protein
MKDAANTLNLKDKNLFLPFDRTQAEDFATKKMKIGDFIIRPSSLGIEYLAITVKDTEIETNHYLIKAISTGYLFLDNTEEFIGPFDTILAIIQNQTLLPTTTQIKPSTTTNSSSSSSSQTKNTPPPLTKEQIIVNFLNDLFDQPNLDTYTESKNDQWYRWSIEKYQHIDTVCYTTPSSYVSHGKGQQETPLFIHASQDSNEKAKNAGLSQKVMQRFLNNLTTEGHKSPNILEYFKPDKREFLDELFTLANQYFLKKYKQEQLAVRNITKYIFASISNTALDTINVIASFLTKEDTSPLYAEAKIREKTKQKIAKENFSLFQELPDITTKESGHSASPASLSSIYRLPYQNT